MLSFELSNTADYDVVMICPRYTGLTADRRDLGGIDLYLVVWELTFIH